MTHDPQARPSPHAPLSGLFRGVAIGLVLLFISIGVGLSVYDAYYEEKIYPNVVIDGINFGGKTREEVKSYWQNQNIPFAKAVFEFKFEGEIATISGSALDLGYDATLSATQAYETGRSGNWLRDFTTKFLRGTIHLTPYFRWKSGLVEETLTQAAGRIDVPVQEALFKFDNGKVTTFRASKNGRAVQKEEALARFESAVKALPHAPQMHVVINIPVYTIQPTATTEKVNSFGIKELIGRGYSEFTGSIPGRIHNVALAASRLNGILIPPGETFSFVDAIGDISAATGYQSAYIIKEGRTVLGDGGGVCQVSTTLFRSALAAGLPIVERHAHAYRVHYYEEAGYKAGIDATVFSPTVDLKIKNDTPAHILIQTKTDTKNLTLTFELYGTHDGRSSEILNHIVYGESSPPPPLYQDDPTLAPGVIRQVDWAAWGAKASFTYRVTRGNEVLQNTTFNSNYRPWQAVYLRGVAAQ
ncbi:VanW family protein [Candidatus Gottesmanbacteria bacterium]|nr:VanW family protein [Candidatus Gottesmanbacteria bacterium]